MSDIRCPLKEAAHISMNQEAVIGKDGALLYSEYEQCVDAAAQLLRRRGCRPGDGVALAVDPDWRLPILVLAVLRAGGRVCPLQSGIPSAHLQSLMDAADCSFVVSEMTAPAGFSGAVLRPEDLTGYTAPFVKGAFPLMPLGRPASVYFDLDAEGRRHALLFSYGNHYYSARSANDRMSLRSGDRILLSTPPWRVESLNTIFRAVLSGAALVVPGDLTEVGSAVQKYGVTHLVLTPVQYGKLSAGFAEGMFPSLKSILICGEPEPEVKTPAVRGLRVFSSFILPEMSSFVSAGETGRPALPLRFGEVKISADGKIMVRGETLFMGYLDGKHVVCPVDADGWFETACRGTLDLNGGLAAGDMA